MIFQIEKAGSSDADRLAQIQLAAFEPDRNACGSGPPGYNDPEHQRKMIYQYEYYVVKDSGEIVGGFYYHIQGSCLHLLRLFVDPEHQGTGVGQCVIQFLTTLTDVHQIVLETPDFSIAAQQFYERRGFVKKETISYGEAQSFSYLLAVS
ncbi:Acetyltransferase (GNAT) family protein [Vibrio aerogenes CECT 7868]|uniref:Acetyltransferase (GNAT) family protein n=1 Tax=Vibrio aerogenes CECT 7868 TaxID=1216006 RepID=A0A1M6A4N8_9VIBR|nr:GNAT family N-acetyltransferase [Vibrio aerogenes]SHI31484.1 Acetyltransferase (GNAT) family protein [Vibrio aerogenes CECT 7868]